MPNYLIALGLSLGVWFIYTLDHLLDGMQLGNTAATRRHAAHFAYKNHLKIVLLLVASILGVLAFYIPSEYYPFVGFILVLTFIHFVINYLVPQKIKKMLFLKEVYIALVVALGFGCTPFLEVEDKWAFGDIKLYLAPLFFINVANLILFSLFDKDADERTETLSIAHFYNKRTLQTIVAISLLASVTYALILWFGSHISPLALLVLLLLQLTLMCICLVPSYFGEQDRYRFYGDLIYVYPLIALPFL